MYTVLALTAVVILILGVLVRTLQFTSKQVQVDPVVDIPVDKEVGSHLSKAIHFKTVSYQEPEKFDRNEFFGLHTFLEKTFPKVHAALTKEVVNECSLLYTWKGTNPDINPILLMAHLDVVPVEPGTENEWSHPAFQGKIQDGYIWGRGTMDIKCGVLGILEAVEALLGEGFTPSRTIYLAFGHDEEVGGHNGASHIAALLTSRNISLEYVLDEGGSITIGIIPGISAPTALIGIAEKGYVSLELTVETEGGHSSMPPPDTGIGILSKAIASLEKGQMPEGLQGVVKQMFNYVGPEMDFTRRMAFANTWLFGWLIKRQLRKSPETHAMIRTTTAPTIIEGGAKENILPKKVKAVINFRILPGDTIKDVVDHVRSITQDHTVKVHTVGQGWEPSPVSDILSPSFQALEKTIRQIFPNTLVAPYLVSGATDSRHYAVLTKNVFKFVPVVAYSEDLKRVHGVNERISLKNYEQCVMFYNQLIRNSSLQ
ncbi:MAG: M20 family peptidase [Theionarchaea archaeon]|nr:M20 family peptidase [Theionarchaea archaeon]